MKERFWTTGIVVRDLGDGRWHARAEFHDNRFGHGRMCGDVQTWGGCEDLTEAIDDVVASLRALEVRFAPEGVEADLFAGIGPHVWYDGDGLSEWPPPQGWRELMNQHSIRLGWMPAYNTATA
jgi:hypothetical protein